MHNAYGLTTLVDEVLACRACETAGFLVRANPIRPAVLQDARVVLMSLTDKACKQIAKISSRQATINEFIFAEFDDPALKEIAGRLASFKKRLEKATLMLAVDG